MEEPVRGGAAQGSARLNPPTDDTIVALSSGRPPAAIAVIRLSGPSALAVAARLAGSLPEPRRASLRALRAADGALLDRALVLVFAGPDSATGEDLVEFHCHGGRAVVEAVEAALSREPRVRRAEPGEFTRRALTNGRIDLAEAEGLADLLEAETETQRRAALAAAEGQVSRMLHGWMDRVADLSARVEASIDYAEEGDLAAEAAAIGRVASERHALAAEIDALLATPPVERWRDGIRVVIAGPPNAGKSTLINALAGRDAAIVSPIAGTTRDRVEVPVRREGVGYVLIDTAGLHEASGDPIEIEGMARARRAAAVADLTLWLGAPSEGAVGNMTIVVHAKADLPDREERPADAAIAVSAFDPDSIARLWQLIAGATDRSTGQMPVTQRIWSACHDALVALDSSSPDAVIDAEQLRQARSSLAAALGIDATEAMLDALFSRFCLGK